MSSSPVRVERGAHHYPTRQIPLAAVCGGHVDVARHTHDFFEIVLVTRGHATHMRFAPDGTEPARYEIVENDLFVVPPGWSHGYERGENLYIWNFVFTPELVEREITSSVGFAPLAHLLAGRTPPDATDLLFKLHLRQHEREAVEAGARGIAWELTARPPGFEVLAKTKLLEVLTLMLRARVDRLRATWQPAESARGAAAQTVSRAIRFMEEHFTEPCRLDDMARAVHLSAHYFCELFKAGTGMPPGKYLARLRVEHAKYLLLTTRLPVTEIALRAGFCDSSYFARVFKAVAGVSPRDFQKTGKLS